MPATMNLTEYRQCTSKLATLTPISTLNKNIRGGKDVTGVLMPGPGLVSLLS